ncbi:hypothetical protein EPO15_17760 [bacterium]|nr:MAG: hypothetical protein EPO15_17760 [bacterium]
MGPAAALVLLLCAPARALTYAERRDALVADYLADGRMRLGLVRGNLEVVQELMLSPHGADGPVEAALLHLDLAEAALTAAEPTLARLPPVEAPAGWSPFEDRLARARDLLKEAAPDLEAVYDRVPVKGGALERHEVGVFEGRYPRIVLRGYYALSGASAEYLATIMAHEAAHALQWEAAHARGESFVSDSAAEAEARQREAAVWKALGAPKDKDFDGAAQSVAEAVSGGEDALARHSAEVEAKPGEWEWVTPAAAAPPRPSTSAMTEAEEPPAEEGQPAVWLDARIGGIRSDFSGAALRGLDGARGVLGTLTEAAAPFPKIVNYELVQVWALSPRRYPAGTYMAFQALHPAMAEIDKARAALAGTALSEEDRALLARYAPDRQAVRVWGARETKAALKDLPKGAAKGLVLASTAVGDAPASDKVVVPGAWVDRSTNTDVAGAWAAHAAAHRAQGTAAPTLEEELEAVESSLAVWEKSGADARFDKAHPDRFLRFRVPQQSGGREALRAYLKTLGFE